MAISNPNNGFVPTVGQMVKVIGACHPRMLNKIVEVTGVEQEEDGSWWFRCKYHDEANGLKETFYTGGLLGGLEPI